MKRTQLVFVLAALCTAPLASCLAVVAAGAGAGVGYVFYERNEVEQDFKVDLETAWDAVREVVGADDEAAQVKSDWIHVTDAELEAPELKIRAETLPDGITRIKVRVGMFEREEHKRKSELILEEIAQKLGVEPIEHANIDASENDEPADAE